jgi:hypothetical protein
MGFLDGVGVASESEHYPNLIGAATPNWCGVGFDGCVGFGGGF